MGSCGGARCGEERDERKYPAGLGRSGGWDDQMRTMLSMDGEDELDSTICVAS
jgi:hypothetical protein